MSRFMRPSEVARECSVTPQTVRNWMAREAREPGTGLRFITLPTGERRVPAEAVEKLLSGATN